MASQPMAASVGITEEKFGWKQTNLTIIQRSCHIFLDAVQNVGVCPRIVRSDCGTENVVFHMECLWFCFSKVTQNELDKVRDHWNSHYIRRSCHDTVAGVTDNGYLITSASVCYILNYTECKVDLTVPYCNSFKVLTTCNYRKCICRHS